MSVATSEVNEADQASPDRRAREVFIAAKRHDLRTPINAIIGYSEMLLEDAEDDGLSWAKDLERIHAAGKSLLATVNETLAADKVESGQIDISDMAALGEQIRLAARNDISSAVGYSEMILEDKDDLDEDTISDLERIRSSAMRMTNLISDIVAFGTEVEEPGAGDEDRSDAGNGRLRIHFGAALESRACGDTDRCGDGKRPDIHRFGRGCEAPSRRSWKRARDSRKRFFRESIK